MNRTYSINITPKNGDDALPNFLLTEFQVLITEPSAWIAEGATNVRGLSFLDVNGRLLDHNVFVHVPLFIKAKASDIEVSEIKLLITSRLFRDYKINLEDITVDVVQTS